MQKEIDIDKAVTAARTLFWHKGYEETAIEEVVQATGINRYGLYKHFGGKLELFLEALNSYYMQRRNIFMESMNDPALPPIEAFERVWHFSITQMADCGNGCMMGNVAAEVAKHEPVVAERVSQYLTEIEWAHKQGLQRLKDAGELTPSVTSEAGAALLVSLILGTGAHAKNGTPAEKLFEIYRSAMRLLVPNYDLLTEHAHSRSN